MSELKTSLHSISIKSHMGDPYIDVFLDGHQMGGVKWLDLSLESGTVPTATLTINLCDAEVDFVNTNVFQIGGKIEGLTHMVGPDDATEGDKTDG